MSYINEKLTYTDIFEFDVILMNSILEKFEDSEKAWEVFYEFYKDSDGYPLEPYKFNMINDVKCTCDALLSINRIYEHEGFSSRFVNTFMTYRRNPIFFFPCEVGGLNTSRYNRFFDRIDHTLFDLKRKCEGKTDCKLENAYNKPKTKKWLEYFESDFNKIVEWFGLEDSFVKKEDGKYKVFDLEKIDGTYIEKYSETYSKVWSKTYYDNLKRKIDIWIEKQL